MSRLSKTRIQTSRYRGTSVPCLSFRPRPPRHETTCQLSETWVKFKTTIYSHCIIIHLRDVVAIILYIYNIYFLNDSEEETLYAKSDLSIYSCFQTSSAPPKGNWIAVHGGKHEFKWNFRKFKEGLKGKKRLLDTTRQLNTPERAPQVGGQLFGVHLPIFNFKF